MKSGKSCIDLLQRDELMKVVRRSSEKSEDSFKEKLEKLQK